MALFDNLIKDIGTRFNLGSKAGPLIQELIGLIGGQPNGVADFLNKFRTAGLNLEVGSWLGSPSGASLSAQQVEQALGGSVADIAAKLGLNRSVVGAALGYALPKVIGALTPGGVIPTIIPASAASFVEPAPAPSYRVTEFQARRAEQASRAQSSRGADIGGPGSSGFRQWLIPGAAALVAIGLLGYLMSGKTADQGAVQSTATAPDATPSVPARLALINENGLIIYSGAVRDSATRTSIIDSLKKTFGADKISGDIIIDRRAYPAVWASNLKLAALYDFKTPGSQALFEGNTVSVGGTVPESDRNRIMNSLKTALGGQYAFTALAEMAPAKPSALAALKPGFSGQDLVSALNQASFGFATKSAEIPSSERAFLHQAAILMKELPPGTSLQVNAYADSADAPAEDMQLSQQRANAVRQALIDGGADPAMIRAKGLASGTVEGRSSDSGVGRARLDKRIEFTIVR